MFGLLNNTQQQQQTYGVQQTTHKSHSNDSNITTTTILKNSSRSNNTNKKQQTPKPKTNNNKHPQHRPRSTSSLSDSVRESKIFTSLSSMHAGLKTGPTNLIEKFLKTELLNSYENLKNYKNFQYTSNNQKTTSSNNFTNQRNSYTEGLLNNFNCLQGSYRSNSDGEFYEAINVVNTTTTKTIATATKVPPHSSNNATEMTIKCSKNLLAEPQQVQAPATLQNYQKLPDYEQHGYIATPEVVQMPLSGASSGEFNTDLNSSQAPASAAAPQTTTTTSSSSSSSNSFYKRLSFGGNRSSKHLDINAAQSQANESASDNSSSSITTTTTTNSLTSTTTAKSNDLHRSSSASSSGDCQKTARERKCKSFNPQDLMPTINQSGGSGGGGGNMTTTTVALTPERLQRRKLMQMISNYEQQNKQLQRELAKEKRRRNEELSRVVKSLLCFESKLKTDMKSVNQRLAEKDNEICRLVRQNRALRKQLLAVKQQHEKDKICDEGVVVGDIDGDGEADDTNSYNDAKSNAKTKEEQIDLMEDCLVLEALQCNNCRKQFYDIELNSSCTQTSKDGGRKNADHNMEHGSSSDDTVSSSFCGARRSVRYTSKRTSGTFRDYMRSRAMNIDDPALEQNSEENTSTISRDDSQTSYEKLNFSRTIERMHGVKCGVVGEIERLSTSEQSGSGASLKGSRPSSRCSSKSSDKSVAATMAAMEEDDGIFSPTQDDDFEEETTNAAVPPTAATNRALKIISHRATEFSEASPKQIYETSTDDWYASASDQEEIVGSGGGAGAKTSYSQAAINPVLECVNQILLQQSMEESVLLREKVSTSTHQKRPQNLTLPTATTNLPRRSSLSGRRNSRNENGASPNSPRTGTLTRKRVHFSTKNSMVHVPRNDEIDDDEDDVDNARLISSPRQFHHTMPGFSTPTLIVSPTSNVIATDVTVETFNYESIYSNEYEPVGSERNSCNLYVDMESALKQPSKNPPALPPKPANLIKFKKSLHQLDEVPDEQQDCDANTSTAASEPDYCSISEVNVGITNVQIVAVVHKPPESETADDNDEQVSEMDLEVSTVASDETCGAISQKTDEIEEIFADIPKLPNVAAIIAPKKQIKQHQQQLKQQNANNNNNTDYLIMSPKVETSNAAKTQNARRLALNLNTELLSTPLKSAKLENGVFCLQLPIGQSTTNNTQQQQQQYKRKHMPNILAEINQRLSLPNTPTTPTTPTAKATPPFIGRANICASNNSLQQQFEEVINSDINMANDSPLQAEFDWYNLDAEYGRASITTSSSGVGSSVHIQPDLLQINDRKLAEIQEDHESLTAAADEYNLDEEFSLSSDQQPTDVLDQRESQDSEESKDNVKAADVNIIAITEAASFPLYNENSPAVPAPAPAKAKKIKKNLANFEKFIEGSGLSTKPLPGKRKIYFSGPYV